MGISEIGVLLGGLALFLYGMSRMSAGLEAVAGNKMKKILEKLTANRFLGVLVGAGITAVIQSSSATTVMVVGFVNSGMLTLRQAVWIIMGANIGTTITGQLIALDIGAIAPFIAFLGCVAVVFAKKPKIQYVGEIAVGLGVLFIGMNMMGDAMVPFRESETFVGLMTKFSNPVLGILAGMIFTAIIQSSSASVGILQALATSGAISFSSSVFVLFGQNIGTCITALLASIGTSRNAKRTTVIHLSFNIIGTILFTTACLLFPIADFIGSFTPGKPAAQIANMHTTFNIVTTCLLLPFGNMLATFAEKLLRDQKEDQIENRLVYLHNVDVSSMRKIGMSAMHFEQVKKEVDRMLDLAMQNVHTAFEAFLNVDSSLAEKVEEKEETVDFLNREIAKCISAFMTHEKTEEGSQTLNAYYKVAGDIERISDHAVNIAGYTKYLEENIKSFSEKEQKEISEMTRVCDELRQLMIGEDSIEVVNTTAVKEMEETIDELTEKYRGKMLNRIRKEKQKEEVGILYSEMLTDFERIGDHAKNIAQQYEKITQNFVQK